METLIVMAGLLLVCNLPNSGWAPGTALPISKHTTWMRIPYGTGAGVYDTTGLSVHQNSSNGVIASSFSIGDDGTVWVLRANQRSTLYHFTSMSDGTIERETFALRAKALDFLVQGDSIYVASWKPGVVPTDIRIYLVHRKGTAAIGELRVDGASMDWTGAHFMTQGKKVYFCTKWPNFKAILVGDESMPLRASCNAGDAMNGRPLGNGDTIVQQAQEIRRGTLLLATIPQDRREGLYFATPNGGSVTRCVSDRVDGFHCPDVYRFYDGSGKVRRIVATVGDFNQALCVGDGVIQGQSVFRWTPTHEGLEVWRYE